MDFNDDKTTDSAAACLNIARHSTQARTSGKREMGTRDRRNFFMGGQRNEELGSGMLIKAKTSPEL